jgi:VWFA-related protein
MRMSKCVFLLCFLPAWGDLLQDDAEIISHQAPATFSSKVNLVSVPVVVRDSKGRAVGGMRPEDFRLFDKGKQQVITKFTVNQSIPAVAAPPGIAADRKAAENTSAALAPLTVSKPASPDRYVAYVFDDLHSRFEDLAQVRAAAERHFAESLAPDSRAAIYTTSGRVTLDFTNDREKLHEALLRIARPSAEQPPGMDCPDIIGVYQADLIVNKGDSIAAGDAMVELEKCLKKEAITIGTVIMYSETALAANNRNTRPSMNVMAGVVQRLSVMPGSRSIVLASPGFLMLSDNREEETQLMDRAIRSNIVINTLDARGLYTPMLGDAASGQDSGLGLGRTPDGLKMRYMRAEAEANKDVMAELADGTGGRFFQNDNGLKEGLDQLAAPPEYSYVLGFSPQNLKYDGSYHGLKVTLANSKGLELQVRRGYWAPRHAADAAEQAKEQIQEAVFSLEEMRDIPVDVTTEFFKLSEAMAELTVQAHLDLNGLKFQTAGDRNVETLTVVTGLFDQDGHYVRGIQRVMDLRLRQQTLEKVLGSGMDVEETFEIAPGRYVVRVVVRDAAGQAMAARNGTVDIR